MLLKFRGNIKTEINAKCLHCKLLKGSVNQVAFFELWHRSDAFMLDKCINEQCSTNNSFYKGTLNIKNKTKC